MNSLARFISDSAQEVIESATGVKVVTAKTMQKVSMVSMRPDIGCFVLFSGDYSGLLIMNFSGQAALSIYRRSMIKLGMPEEELSTEFTAEDVVNSIGETINQVIGKARRSIEHQYGLGATATQPRAIALNSSIMLTVDAHDVSDELCRRLSFKIDGHPFHIEMAMEKAEFISLEEGLNPHERNAETLKHEVNMDEYRDKASASAPAAAPEVLDFDALMKQQKD